MVYSEQAQKSVLGFIPKYILFNVSRKVRDDWVAIAAKSVEEKCEYGGCVIARKGIYKERPKKGMKPKSWPFTEVCYISVEKGTANSFLRLGLAYGMSLIHIINYGGIHIEQCDIMYAGEWHSHWESDHPSPADLAFFNERSKEAVLFLVTPKGFRIMMWDVDNNTTYVSRIYAFHENPRFKKKI